MLKSRPTPLISRPETPSGSSGFMGTMSLSTPPPTPKHVDFPALSSPAPDETVREVLERLVLHHPNLRPPSLSDRNKFLEKARQLPGLPEWMWYGMLHYAVVVVTADGEEDDEEMKEVVDFGILDELLGEGDLQGPGRLWDMTFYYMFLHLEGTRGSSQLQQSDSVVPPALGNGNVEEEQQKKELQLEDKDTERRILNNNNGSWMPSLSTWVIVFLLLVISVLLVFPCNPVEALRQSFARAYTNAADLVSNTLNSACRTSTLNCRQVGELLMDNIKYRLGLMDLAGAVTPKSEL
ncbi:hypothetical protein K440DRAFT_618617 [Wilcoxina mikolae CBS 423.85]|nr:hypothetical protein K440DRAFT_618617 [Wilcoxina mikolae CBS 423.85]